MASTLYAPNLWVLPVRSTRSVHAMARPRVDRCRAMRGVDIDPAMFCLKRSEAGLTRQASCTRLLRVAGRVFCASHCRQCGSGWWPRTPNRTPNWRFCIVRLVGLAGQSVTILRYGGKKLR